MIPSFDEFQTILLLHVFDILTLSHARLWITYSRTRMSTNTPVYSFAHSDWKPEFTKGSKKHAIVTSLATSNCSVINGDVQSFILKIMCQSVLGRNKCLCWSSHALCYGCMGSCATHNSFASYDGDVVCACHANKADCQ